MSSNPFKSSSDMQEVVEYIASIAESIETEDPIDWGMLTVDERSTYKMMASSVLQNYLDTPESGRDMMLLAMLTKMIVENFVLNLKLLQARKG